MRATTDYNNEAVMLQMDGKLEQAERAFIQALVADPQNATAHNNLGFLLTRQRRFEEALKHLDQALIINPESDTAHLNKGNVHLAMGDLRPAYEHYSKSLEINNENPLAWEMYARFFMAANQPGEASRAWAQAVQLKPDDLNYRLELAVCLITSGRYEDARPVLEELVQYDAQNVRVWTQLGIVYLMRKDYGTAAGLFTRALGLAPEDESARYHLGLTCLATGEREKAEQEFHRIVQLHPENIKARTDLAVLLLSRGDLESALGELETCLATDPDYSKALYYQALVWHQMGRDAEAEMALKSLAAEPDGAYTQQAQAYLEKYIRA